MEEIEEKLKLERDTIQARSQYKAVYNQLQDIKKEYNTVLSAVESKTKLLEEQKSYLTEVLKDISEARLSWTIEKDTEWQKVNAKMSEAENVLKRKQELNEQEQKLRDIEQSTTDKLNEQRRLELKNKQEVTLLDVEKRQLIEDKKKVIAYGKKVEKDKDQFKEDLTNFINQWQTKF